MTKKDMPLKVSKKGLSRKKFLVFCGGLASFVACILIIMTYVTAFITGLYYVAIASAPNKERAVQEVASINKIFDQRGERDIRARACASTATGSPWYMIAVGGFHISRAEAEKTLAKTGQSLGAKMHSDAFIYIPQQVLLLRRLRKYILEIFLD